MDQRHQIRLGIDLYIYLPQDFVQFRQRQLYAGLHSVQKHGVRILPNNFSRNIKLVSEHELGQIRQHVTLAFVKVVESTRTDICLLKDLLGRRVAETLLQKKSDTG